MKIGIDIGGSHIAVGLLDKEEKIVAKKEKDILREQNKNDAGIIGSVIKI